MAETFISADLKLWVDSKSYESLKQQRNDLLEAAKWINDIISTACDGGDAWCAVRDRLGASEWAKNLEAAIANCE